MSNLISIENLVKTFYGAGEPLSILENLKMSVQRGTKVVILGESGCGKSTLLNIIGGLEEPTSGIVHVGDYNIGNLNENELTEYRSKYLGLVFQFHYLLKDFTALENVMLPMYMTGVSKKKALSRARQLLCDVGLESRLSHLPAQMSGGERQRVAVARALINDPELVLADEPTGNLDPKHGANISDILFNVVEKYGKTLVMVTHDISLASRGDVSYKIQGGQLVSYES
ncbi:MAG: lipoprotein ABC transporter ATP-binding protein [Treponema sp. CETP13]|nr:MAG: lipoprotein ABC transporter ATP-binding protein [Treponema sp. CETP13]